MDIQIYDKEPRKRKKTMRILLIILCILVATLIGFVIYISANISKIWRDIEPDEGDIVVEDVEDNTEGLPEVIYKEGDVVGIDKAGEDIDIMLIGVDNRNSEKFTGLSDVMIYMRVNTEKNSIKLASFMRDTLVDIDGYGKKKLNSAYSYGRIDLMYQTYNESFGLKPDYYMVVNFYGMEDIIDALGGVDIELADKELEYLNASIKEINGYDNKDVEYVNKSGLQHLNGRQAVAYMRIRKLDSDAGRIGRQQNVLNALFEEACNISAGEIPALISTLAQYVRTDIPIATMLNVAKSVQGMQGSGLQTFRYPDDYENGYYKGAGSIVQPECFDTEIQKLNDFLND